jgi:hypothetical protein
VSELCPPTMMASARISMICGLCMLSLCKKKWIWRRRSTRRCNDFRICCARNWLGFDVIQRSQWLHLGGDTMIFLLQMPPSPTCLIGSGRRFGCFLPLLQCKKNITCFALVGVFKMLAGVECEHLLELKKLALSCDASILHDVPDDIGRIAKKLVRNWWTNHGLPYCMQKIKEENRVSFATMCFDERRCVVV